MKALSIVCERYTTCIACFVCVWVWVFASWTHRLRRARNILAYYDLHTRLNEIWSIGEKYRHKIFGDSWLCARIVRHQRKNHRKQRCRRRSRSRRRRHRHRHRWRQPQQRRERIPCVHNFFSTFGMCVSSLRKTATGQIGIQQITWRTFIFIYFSFLLLSRRCHSLVCRVCVCRLSHWSLRCCSFLKELRFFDSDDK